MYPGAFRRAQATPSEGENAPSAEDKAASGRTQAAVESAPPTQTKSPLPRFTKTTDPASSRPAADTVGAASRSSPQAAAVETTDPVLLRQIKALPKGATLSVSRAARKPPPSLSSKVPLSAPTAAVSGPGGEAAEGGAAHPKIRPPLSKKEYVRLCSAFAVATARDDGSAGGG